MSFFDSIVSALSSVTAPLSARVGPSAASSGVSAYPNTGAKIWPLSSMMREEMKKGVVYNMKVVLRGMRGTGKTTLLSRLSGHPMPSYYRPSIEISATTIRLCGRGCQPHEGTRVDIWDVVDEGGNCAPGSANGGGGNGGERNLPLPSGKNQEMLHHQLALLGTVADAKTVDVYQACNLAIFMIDPSRHDSFEYAKREAAKVPYHTCVIFALNFCDVPRQKRMVTFSEVEAACRQLRRATTAFVAELMQGRSPLRDYSAPAMAVSISAAVGTGIPQLVDMLNVPNTMVRLTAMEERTRGLYAWMEALSLSLASAAASSAEGTTNVTPPFTSSQLPVTADAPSREGYAAATGASSTTKPSTGILSPSDSVKPLSVPKIKSATTAGCDAHGIQLGFFSDVTESSKEETASDSSSSSSEEIASTRKVQSRRGGPAGAARRAGASLPHGKPAVSQPKMPSAPSQEETPPAETHPPRSQATTTEAAKERDCRTEDPVFTATSVPEPATLTRDSLTSPREQVVVILNAPVTDAQQQEEAAARATAVEARILAAVTDNTGPSDAFFALDSPVISSHDEVGGGNDEGQDPDKSEACRELVARSLATYRNPEGAAAASKRNGDRTGHIKPQQTVQVDVDALLAAMQATLDAKPTSDETGGSVEGVDETPPETSAESKASKHRSHKQGRKHRHDNGV